MTNVVFRKLSGWVGALACAGLLAACGGGGGSPGTNPNKPDTGTGAQTVASVVVTPSATSLASSGQAGTEVTLTALVKDGNNTAVAGATVTFAASSGSVGTVSGVSDASGIVTAKLSTGGDATLRDITVTASVGSVKSAAVTVKVVQAVQTLTLTTDSGTLASSGTADVTVTALVRDSNNAIQPGVKVTLSADSGTLASSSNITDAQGKVTAKLSTGGDATSRVIKVTGLIDGVPPTTTNVTVIGTTVKVSANATANVNVPSDVSVKVTDSAGKSLAGVPVTFASNVAGSLTVKNGGGAVTDNAGQLTLVYKVAAVPTDSKGNPVDDVIVVRSMGESGSTSVKVSASNFTVTSSQPQNAPINTCISVAVHSDVGGTNSTGIVSLNSSLGSVYTDSGCSSSGTQNFDGSGNATFYVQAVSPGIATLTATANGNTSQGTMEFVAKLLPSAVVTLQGDPAVVGTNTTGSTTQQATIRAVVRDGTATNNLVKNAKVSFSIVTDASGGSLTQPSVIFTGSDGAASVNYIAGTSPTALNGVLIKAEVLDPVTSKVVTSTTTTLTVSKKSLFISAGTGRDVRVPNSTTYSLDYVVLVTDASGNAASGVNITASVLPRHYRKGKLVFPGTTGPWQLPTDAFGRLPYACPNEDANNNGQLDAGEDFNGNGRLDPGIPVSVTSNVTTDAAGTAIVTMTYPRDRAVWLGLDLTIRGSVAGSEAVYVAYIPILPGATTDYSDGKVSPPGAISPYGLGNIDPLTGLQSNYLLTDCKNPN
jgi:hypothetical protein